MWANCWLHPTLLRSGQQNSRNISIKALGVPSALVWRWASASLSICFLSALCWLFGAQGLRIVLNQTRHWAQPWKFGLTFRKRTQVGVQPRQDIPLLMGLGLSFCLSPFLSFSARLFLSLCFCLFCSLSLCQSLPLSRSFFPVFTRLDKLNLQVNPEMFFFVFWEKSKSSHIFINTLQFKILTIEMT